MAEAKTKETKESKAELSLLDLERMLSGKRSQLQSLLRRRQRLETQLKNVEEQISGMQGGRGVFARLGLKFSFRTRPKNERPLKGYVEEVLKANRKGLSLQDLSEKVLAAGYRTQSVKFLNTLYQCVYHADNIHRDAKSGLWKLS